MADAPQGPGGAPWSEDCAYDDLVDSYHWLYDDVALHIGTTTPGVRAAIAGLEAGSAVLDAACGIGLDARALARRGMEVTATDASRSMVDSTTAVLREAGLEGTVRYSTWADLPESAGRDQFDAVLCTGNSLAHVDAGGIGTALAAFALVLRPGGLLVFDTHHWEIVLAAGDRTLEESSARRRNGRTCQVRYHWQVDPDADGHRSCRLCIQLDVTDAAATTTVRRELVFHPFTVGEILDLVREHFEVVSCDVHPDDDRYTVVARRPAVGSAGRRPARGEVDRP